MKVGDYVRTKNGIAKITSIDGVEEVAYTDNKNIVFGVEEQRIMEVSQFTEKYVDSYYKPNDLLYVLNYSSNIIDLIEVGDYVNGYLVKDIDYAFDDVVMNNKNARVVPYIDCNKNNYIDDIKSIVTKEQFESMEYKV